MMKFVLFCALVALCSASDVLDCTDSDFASRVAEHETALVEFFAPWCGHCKNLAPEYETAATTLLKSDPPVALIKVDCTVNTEVCGKYGVSGYPTLKIFRNGEYAEDYNGPRQSGGIVSTMKKKAGPSSKNLESVEQAEKFLANEDAGIVGFFTDEESDIAKQFKKAADGLDKYRFAHTFSAEVLEKYGYNNDIVLFRPARLNSKFEEQVVKYDDDSAVHKIKTWVKANANGLCGHRTKDNADDFTNPLVVALYDVDYQLNPKGSNYWRNRVMKVGKKFKDAGKVVNFAVSAVNDFGQEMEQFGLQDKFTNKPVVFARGANGEKYAMSDEFSMDTLEKFVTDFLEGNLEEYLKSEPVPDNTDNAVKVVVAKNFDEIVNNPEKDVLIEFYAPWCGHCKSLEPKYNELAEQLKDEDGITIAKMDATANDVNSKYQVSGFPTLFFAPKGSKDSPKKYEGGREVDDFIKYLAKESTDPMKGYDKKGKKIKSEL